MLVQCVICGGAICPSCGGAHLAQHGRAMEEFERRKTLARWCAFVGVAATSLFTWHWASSATWDWIALACAACAVHYVLQFVWCGSWFGWHYPMEAARWARNR